MTVEKSETIQGQSVFIVETTPAGIAVQTALLTAEGKLIQMPAIFPDVAYALSQIDELKKQVQAHFSNAALIGAQAMASQQERADEDSLTKVSHTLQ
jgi:hypothetical protein